MRLVDTTRGESDVPAGALGFAVGVEAAGAADAMALLSAAWQGGVWTAKFGRRHCTDSLLPGLTPAQVDLISAPQAARTSG
ncbi:MAG: hypothetical protein ACO1NY_10720 [Pseudorhodoplanes sp.]